jgi:hypothetical protein
MKKWMLRGDEKKQLANGSWRPKEAVWFGKGLFV